MAMEQVEFHSFSWMDQGAGCRSQAGTDEVRHRPLGANLGHRVAAWQAHPAAERTDPALARPAVPGRSAFWNRHLCYALKKIISDSERGDQRSGAVWLASGGRSCMILCHVRTHYNNIRPSDLMYLQQAQSETRQLPLRMVQQSAPISAFTAIKVRWGQV
jgi:hypothetical protein